MLRPLMVQIFRWERDGSVTVVGTWGGGPNLFPAGSNWPWDNPSLAELAERMRAGELIRIEDVESLAGDLADAGLGAGVGSAAGAPIVVDGETWGHMSLEMAKGTPLPDRVEEHLAEITELVATAIASSANREQLSQLAEEQAALRRVATLVARGAPPGEVFDAVVGELGRLLDAGSTGLVRFEDNQTATSSPAGAGSTRCSGSAPCFPWAGRTSSRRSREPARRRGWTTSPAPHPVRSPIMRIGCRPGRRSAAPSWSRGGSGARWSRRRCTAARWNGTPSGDSSSSPIWSAPRSPTPRRAPSSPASRRSRPRCGASRRSSRRRHRRRSCSPRSPRRRRTPSGPLDAAIFRFEPDATGTVVAVWGEQPADGIRINLRLPLDGSGAAAGVFRERRPVRVDDYSTAVGAIAERSARHGIRRPSAARSWWMAASGVRWWSPSTSPSRSRPTPSSASRSSRSSSPRPSATRRRVRSCDDWPTSRRRCAGWRPSSPKRRPRSRCSRPRSSRWPGSWERHRWA